MDKFVISRVEGDPYLTRWRIIHTPWFGVLLHKIDSPDPDQHPHDHPWNFITVILKGGYVEDVTELLPWMTPNGEMITDQIVRRKKWGWLSWHKMRLGDYHKIVRLMDKPTWTLVLTGSRQREWGFLVKNDHVHWKKYLGLA